MYPAAMPIRAPRGSARCHACGTFVCRPARVLRFADPERRRGRFLRFCQDCYTQLWLLERPASCAAVRADSEARRAWYRQVGPILFDRVREGMPEPENLPALVRWLLEEQERQHGFARLVRAQFGADFPYTVPDALTCVLAACVRRLPA